MTEPVDEVTPPWIYKNRRSFLRSAAMTASIAATAGVYRWLNPVAAPVAARPSIETLNTPDKGSEQTGTSDGTAATNSSNPDHSNTADSQANSSASAQPELKPALAADDLLTAERFILNYNNFYEFTTSKTQVASLAADFRTDGWQLEVDGLVDKPRKFSIDDLHALSRPKERIYRMRCVEGWSMVIPWVGIELSHVLAAVQPRSQARYVAFETLLDPARMPGQKVPVLEWPYVEGLRLDEAMHPLTILATGLYGKTLPPQDGAPVRLVVPWKYGFKGIKSIVRISLVADEPKTSWNLAAPHEYGFYANVNPNVDHPRWSQATEQRIGEFKRRPTLMFNGYEEQVAELYRGMDLRKYF